MEKKLKSWQGWLLFGGSMVVVFVLGLCVSALMERRAELESVFNNRRTVITSRGLKREMNYSRMISPVNIRLGRKQRRQISRVNSTETLQSMYWSNVLKW